MDQRGIGTKAIVGIVVGVVAAVVIISIVVVVFLGGGRVISYESLWQDYDNMNYNFKSYGPGDVVNVRFEIDNILLITQAMGTMDSGVYTIGESFLATYGISLPVTMIETRQGPPIPLSLEGDWTAEYKIGDTVVLPLHIVSANVPSGTGEMAKEWLVYWAMDIYSLASFSVSVSPTSATIGIPVSGDNVADAEGYVERIGAYNKIVTLWVGGVPSGVNVSFSPSSGIPPFYSTMIISVSNTAAQGVSIFTIGATDVDGTEQTTPFMLTLV